VIRLALMGMEVPEIASTTGRGLRDAHAILDTHYLHRDPKLAWNAMRKLEMGYGRRAADGASEQRARVFCKSDCKLRFCVWPVGRKAKLNQWLGTFSLTFL
jgi:hypothetical protein